MVAHCSRSACQDAASATRARRATLTPPRQCTGACHVTTCPDSCRPGVTDRAEPARVQDGTDKQQQQAAAVPHCAAARQSVENPRRSVAVRGGGRGWRTPSRTRTRAANSASRRGYWRTVPTARRGSGRPPYWQRTGDGARGTGAYEYDTDGHCCLDPHVRTARGVGWQGSGTSKDMRVSDWLGTGLMKPTA